MRGSWVVLGIAALAGCAGGAGGPDPGETENPLVCMGSGPVDVGGRFAVLASLTVHINAQGLVDTDASAALLIALDVAQTGQAIGVVAELCDLAIPDVPVAGQERPVHFEPGPGLLASVRPVSGTGSLDGTSACATFASDPITLLIGARMSPPTQGTLPEADSTGAFTTCLPATASCYDAITSNCVCDQENDDKPGATLRAQNVPAVPLEEVYVNLRTSFSLTGQVWSSDLILGEVEASLEQGILGCRKAGNVPCSTGEVQLVKNLNPDVTASEEEPSTFRAVRVPEGTACAQIIEMRDELFPR